jgi:xylulokinase
MIASFLIRPDRATSQPRYSRTLVRLSRRDPARLPPLRPTGSVLGPVTPAAASDLGIAEGTPVVAGISDLHSAYLGSGALGAAHLVVSSTTWLGLALNKPRSASRRGLNTVPGVAPAKLLIEDCQSNGGLAMDWVIRTIWRDGPSDEESIYERFAAAALRSPSGAYGLRFLPWLNGERTPMGNPDLRGALVGVSTTTTSDDIARATLEGIAANACLLIESVAELVGAPITQLRLMGRCVELDALCQILADVGGLACHRVRDPRLANLRGAAIFAAHALDALAPGEVESWTPVGRSFFPATGQAGRV